MALEPEKLKPVLHEKIERMDGEHLDLVNRLLLQFEAEERAERLGNPLMRFTLPGGDTIGRQ
jgi:hypothetical protein